MLFAFDRVGEMAPQHPEWKTKMPFKAIVTGDREAMAKFTLKDIEVIAMATHTGMTAEAFTPLVKDWMAKAKHPHFDKPYPQMVYQPMLEVMKYLRDNGYRTYIVTGGGQDFVRAYAQQVYGIPPEQIIGSALDTQYAIQQGRPGHPDARPEASAEQQRCGQGGRHLSLHREAAQRCVRQHRRATGRCWSTPRRAAGASLEMLVLHDDATREYAYGPAQGLPDSKVSIVRRQKYMSNVGLQRRSLSLALSIVLSLAVIGSETGAIAESQSNPPTTSTVRLRTIQGKGRRHPPRSCKASSPLSLFIQMRWLRRS